MKHRRSIDLAPVHPARFREPSSATLETVASMREWEVLGAKCGKCGHTAWLDKASVIRRCGNQYLQNMGGKLVCRCGNRTGNSVLVGTLGRD